MIEEEFWTIIDKQEEGECWIWMGSVMGRGYGQAYWHGHCIGAHRVAWELTNGPIPSGMCVCHMCDNPPCCNPAHLFLGSQKDNMQDGIRKGRVNNEEHRRKISKVWKGKHLSEDHKRKIGESNKGHVPWISGSHHSDATKCKISNAQKGKPKSEESRRRMSEARKGKHPSEETKRRMSEAATGKPKSEEHRRNMSEAVKRQWAIRKLNMQLR